MIPSGPSQSHGFAKPPIASPPSAAHHHDDHRPATDLGFLLHKHPDRVQTFSIPFGKAHVFYTEATKERCTAALSLAIDPVGLVRRGREHSGFALAEYVNDRPYVASSFLSVALVNAFKSAMAGTCKGHEELAATPIPLEAWLPAVPARGGEALVRRLFEPLGYQVDVTAIALDPQFPDWGDSRHVGLRLAASLRLADLLNHICVLLAVLDDDKHYGPATAAAAAGIACGYIPVWYVKLACQAVVVYTIGDFTANVTQAHNRRQCLTLDVQWISRSLDWQDRGGDRCR